MQSDEDLINVVHVNGLLPVVTALLPDVFVSIDCNHANQYVHMHTEIRGVRHSLCVLE